MGQRRPKDETAIAATTTGDRLLIDGATTRSMLVSDFRAETIELAFHATTASSLPIAIGSKLLTTQADLAIRAGSRVRLASRVNVANFMEGEVTAYSGEAMTVDVSRLGPTAAGTFADWNITIAGEPGAGDMSSALNLSDVASKPSARANLQIPDLIGLGFPMYNGKIVDSYGANAVTFSIKTLAGADPSAGNPVRVGFPQLDGSYVERAVTAPVNFTLSAGSTVGMPNGQSIAMVVSAIDVGGVVELAAASRIGNTTAAGSNAAAFYFNDFGMVSTTAEGGAGGADTGGILYSSTARANVQARVLCRFEWDNGLALAGLWATVSTRCIVELPQRRRSSLPPSFFAHKNNVSQTGLSHLAYTKLTWPVCRFNVGGFFDVASGRWGPPAGLVEISAGGWWNANVAASPANSVLKIIKNGFIDIGAGEGWAPAGFVDTAGCAVANVRDLANGVTDYYEIYAYSTSKNGLNDCAMDGNPAHVWFSGAVIGG